MVILLAFIKIEPFLYMGLFLRHLLNASRAPMDSGKLLILFRC